MNTIFVLALILLLLMTALGKKKGFMSFLVMFLHLVIIITSVLFMTDHAANPVIITMIASVIMSYTTLFLINGDSQKTRIAFVSTLVTMTLLIGLIYVVILFTHTSGFSTEEVEELAIYHFYFGIDYRLITTSVVMLSTLGAVLDEAVSVVSPMFEFYYHNKNITKKALFMSGMRVGFDLLATSANTLFFAFFGGYLALIVRFFDLNYQLSELLNAKVFAQQIVIILLSGIGILLIIPITAYWSAHILTKKRQTKRVTK